MREQFAPVKKNFHLETRSSVLDLDGGMDSVPEFYSPSKRVYFIRLSA